MEYAVMNVLVIDVGGTNIKVRLSGTTDSIRILSGPSLTAQSMVAGVLKATAGWSYDVVSVGLPTPVRHGKLLHEPTNLGGGWADFDFAAGFAKPVKLINDAAMQALGSYRGGQMLFLGLGTGLGSAMIFDGVLHPMELGHLPYRKGQTFEDYLGVRGLHRMGPEKWQRHVHRVVEILRTALQGESVVLGGGNVKKLKTLPEHTTRGDNTNAFVGGERLWTPVSDPTDTQPFEP
jgi:polyphosphate glucokinase